MLLCALASPSVISVVVVVGTGVACAAVETALSTKASPLDSGACAF